MANPIARRTEEQPTVRNSEEFLRNWCWERNKQAMQANWLHWLYVSRDKETGALTTKARVGSDANDILKVLDGWYPDFMNWEPERLDAEFRILRHIAKMGMPQEWFERNQLPRLAKPLLRLPARD